MSAGVAPTRRAHDPWPAYAALLDRLTTFATVLNATLDTATMNDDVASGAGVVIPAESVVLVTRDEATGAYLIAAVSGGDRAILGQPIQPGEGISGRAIVARGVDKRDTACRQRRRLRQRSGMFPGGRALR